MPGTVATAPTISPAPPRRIARRRTRVAIAGCGVVGGELVRLLEGQRARLVELHGLDIEVVRVLVRDGARPRTGIDGDGVLTSDLDRFLDAGADVVVEAIGGLEPATRIATATLRRGAQFITANKTLIAAHGSELARLARRSGATLGFDAAVGGGVPAVRLIESALGGAAPRAVRGILNGTTNLILTLVEQGQRFDDALAEARRRGFAEAECARDLDGRDAADKIAILAWTAFGIAPERVIVRRRGLLPDPHRLVQLARLLDGRLRVVAECELVNAGREVIASVDPVIVRADSPLGRTLFEDNRIELYTGWSAPLSATGPGAGGAPTATALLSDLVAPRSSTRPATRDVAAVADARPFPWVIGTRHTPASLRAILDGARVAVDELGRSGSETWARTSRVSWPALASALEGLADDGPSPVVARIDDGRSYRLGVTE